MLVGLLLEGFSISFLIVEVTVIKNVIQRSKYYHSELALIPHIFNCRCLTPTSLPYLCGSCNSSLKFCGKYFSSPFTDLKKKKNSDLQLLFWQAEGKAPHLYVELDFIEVWVWIFRDFILGSVGNLLMFIVWLCVVCWVKS